MNGEAANALMLLAYLGIGVPGIALFLGWGIKHLNPAKAKGNDRREDFVPLQSGRINRVLVPLDLTPRSLEALQYARVFAKECDAVVLLLHVVQLNIVGEERGVPRSGLIAQMAGSARHSLTKLIERLWADDLSATMAIREGRTHEEIVEEACATHADMIIMSAPRHVRLPQFLRRNTLSRVLRRSPCPVLVVGRDVARAGR